MTDQAAASGADSGPREIAYAYRPSLLGAPWQFSLTANGMDWSASGRSGHIPFRDFQKLRMSYKPASMQTNRYLTEIWAAGAPRLDIVSSSWKSLVEQERLDDAYAIFIGELHRRLAQAGVPVTCIQGRPPFVYWPGLAVFVLVALGLAAMVARALQSDTLGGAAFIGAFLILFLWQGGNFFRRNRPGTYALESPPPELMPRT